MPALLVAAVTLAGLVLLTRHMALPGRLFAGPAPDPWRARWDDAVRRHGETARAYAAYECDVRAVLLLPALADVTQRPTARFVDAFAEAGALLTERFPGPEYAQRLVAAVEREERAWSAAVDAAERARDARFAPGERRLVEQTTALLDLALSSPYDAERRTAYRQAAHRLAELERRTGWRLPRPAAAALEHQARVALVAAG
jgi:hypothetical protein